MKASRLWLIGLIVLSACTRAKHSELSQVPTWTADDMDFFLHGSLGTEVVPDKVMNAFRATYPDLFPDADFAAYGMIPDPAVEMPVGFSRRKVDHLAGLPSVGINCASCHVTEIQSRAGQRVRVLGGTAHFNVEAFFGAIIVATFRTEDPANMGKFLANFLGADAALIAHEHDKIAAAIQEDPTGSKGAGPGGLQPLTKADFEGDLSATTHGVLKLLHNMRAALHVPDQPPAQAPVMHGPGRNDPWNILSFALFNESGKPAPIKFGIVWNEDQHPWVHYDGNTRAPIVRNLAAALGLGAPLIGNTGVVDFAVVERQTMLSEGIRPPKYPWGIDRAAADRGAKFYAAACASCHDGAQTDARLHAVSEIGTDPNRAEMFTQELADKFNKFFADLKIEGYHQDRPPLRGTNKYWSPDLAGVWARGPYLHNGSVRTMAQLLMPPDEREKKWHRGTRVYDEATMGYLDDGTFLLDTAEVGSSNAGHDYGTRFTATQKSDLIEYLKTK